MGNRKTIFNIIAALSAFTMNIIINFFLSPYIIKHIGIEAFGFISLATNFIIYIEIFTTALNSMSSRFIALSVHKNKITMASEYFSTVFFSNIAVTICLLILASFFIYKVNLFLQVPNNLLLDVQLLFFTILLNFCCNLFSNAFSSSYIVKNKIYLSSVVQMKSNIIKVGVILVLFLCLTPHITYYGIGMLLATIYMRGYDIFYKRQLLPNIRLKLNLFSWDKLKEILSSGSWNMITRVGTVLSVNLDILFVNLFLGATATGILGLVKIVPNFFYNITGTLIGVFFPNLIELYAQNKYQEMLDEINKSMKLFSFLFSIPLVAFLSFGDIFFKLWVPSQDYKFLYLISTILLISMAIIGPTTLIFNVFTVVNKLRLNSIGILCTGIINSVSIFFVLKYTDWGLIAVAAIPTLVNLSRNILITIPYGAICLGFPWYKFFPVAIKAFLSVMFVCAIGIFVKSYYLIDTWFGLVIISSIFAIVSCFVQYVIVLDRNERYYLLNKVRNLYNR